jgi:hypothetical protein
VTLYSFSSFTESASASVASGVNAFMTASEYPEKIAVSLMQLVSEQLAKVPALEFPEVIPPQFRQKGGH